MGRLNNDEQFKFLISCIRYSNNGKVDFAEVARECSIVTKGAAAKRYERMMKAHGIHQSSSSVRDVVSIPLNGKEDHCPQPRKKRKTTSTPPFSNRMEDLEIPQKAEDIGKCPSPPENTAMKYEPVAQKESERIEYQWLNYHCDSIGNSMDDPSFSDFIHSDVFEPVNASVDCDTAQQFQTNNHRDDPQGKTEEVREGRVVVVD